jgi:murein DD-endopeptidase MepM/ murein hydrolase activator NlpD
MKLKNIKSFRKPLLLLGASLGGLMVLQAAHAMVKAFDFEIMPTESVVSAANPTSSESPEEALQIPNPVVAPEGNSVEPTPRSDQQSTASSDSSDSASTSTESSESSAPTATSSQGTGAERQLLAINTGETEPQRPVSQISPDDIVLSEWHGASFPVEDFQAYTSPFGYRQSPEGGYSTEFHYGLDMAAPDGSYIRNWWGGKVVEVSDDSNCGTSVVVESGTWMHIYCHMRGHVEEDNKGRYMIDREGGIQIWEGQDLPAGARIGRVGMTGRTTGPHLHWGLKFNENWVDPALVLRAMYVSQQAAQPSGQAE